MTLASAPIVPDRNATFHPFPWLPLEIRRMNWRAALSGPRNVTLKRFCLKDPEYPVILPNPGNYRISFGSHAGAITGFTPVNSNPAIFYTCIESLKVASETYTLTFGSLEVSPRTWFNYDMDSVHLDVPFLNTTCTLYESHAISRIISSPNFLLSLAGVDGREDVEEVVPVAPDADGIYGPLFYLTINGMGTSSEFELIEYLQSHLLQIK
ncbi:uncharacterized protein EAF01_011985 [Botrytis porri]|nr:uncharacterized protein EAF01_011985 [Botrytis porri]KAF7880716.1 hypothetical protein EAF01_011985 [Botrytis porri]